MFCKKYFVEKEKINTKYGSVSIEKIEFTPIELQKVLPKIVLDEENLKYMFAEPELNKFKRNNIYKRFIPKDYSENVNNEYVANSIKSNKNFYSFLAEGILGLVYRDLYDYQLSKGLIDVLDTVNDTHTGVDACMYDRNNNIIILGEAKFYEDLNSGINKIINDFTNKKIKNKIESLMTASENDILSNEIVIKNLEKQNYENYTIQEFLNQKLIFAGFVLHSEQDVSHYGEKTFYDNYYINSQMLKENIKKSLEISEIKSNYNIIIVHLPIKDKKELIIKVMELANKKLNEMSVENNEWQI